MTLRPGRTLLCAALLGFSGRAMANDPAAQARRLAEQARAGREAKTTTVSSPHPIAGVFVKMAQEKFGGTRWSFPNNEFARSVERRLPNFIAELPRLQRYYESAFDLGKSVENCNALLAKHRFRVALRPPQGERAISAAAVINIDQAWRQPGSKVTVNVGGEGRSGAYFPQAAFFQAGGHAHPVARLETEGGLQLFLTRYEGQLTPPGSAVSALDAAQRLRNGAPIVGRYEGLVFPAAKYEGKDTESVKGAKTVFNGDEFEMEQFVFEQQVSLDHKRVMLKAAAAGTASTRGLDLRQPQVSPRALVIDGNYLFWLEVDGVVPFAGLIAQDSMQ